MLTRYSQISCTVNDVTKTQLLKLIGMNNSIVAVQGLQFRLPGTKARLDDSLFTKSEYKVHKHNICSCSKSGIFTSTRKLRYELSCAKPHEPNFCNKVKAVCSLARPQRGRASRRGRGGYYDNRVHRIPRDYEDETVPMNAESFASLESMLDQKISYNPEVKESTNWIHLTEELLIGDYSQSTDEVDYIASTGPSALISIVSDAKDAPTWDDVCERATSLEVVAAEISMDNDVHEDQATCLPEAVKIIASLTAAGRKVYLCQPGGRNLSSLVALGFLTFVKAMDLKDAMDVIYDVYPESKPSIAAWEQARSRLLSGQTAKISKYMKSIQAERLSRNEPGTSGEDWLKAQRLVICDQFQRSVGAQTQLADALTQIAYMRASRSDSEYDQLQLETDEVVVLPDPSTSSLPLASQLLLEIAGMDGSEAPSPSSSFTREQTAMEAARRVKQRMEDLVSEIKEARRGENEALMESKAAVSAMDRLKFRIESLLKQVIEERATTVLSMQARSEAELLAEISRKELDVERQNIVNLRAEAVEQIGGLQRQLADMQMELMGSTQRVKELEKSLEEEKGAARDTIRNMEREAQSKEQQLQQIIATLRVKVEEEAALYGRELEAAMAEHEKELEATREHYEGELKMKEFSHAKMLEAMDVSKDRRKAAIELSSAVMQNRTLSEQLTSAEEYMMKMSEELDVLHSKVVQDKMKREAQVQEELELLRTAQDHVDRMAAEKMSLLEQKTLLQKTVLVTIGLAIAGPLTVLAIMGSSNVQTVDALEVNHTQRSVRRMSLYQTETGVGFDGGVRDFNPSMTKSLDPVSSEHQY